VRTVLSKPSALFWPAGAPAARAGQPDSH